MTDRKKLIKLLESLCVDYGAMAIFFTSWEAEVLADHLISHGVTVRERGRWEEYQVPHIMCCSECDWATGEQSDFNFCPNCGADMRGEEDG